MPTFIDEYPPGTVEALVDPCPRCGLAHNEPIYPLVSVVPNEYTHHMICPSTKQPVMVRFIPPTPPSAPQVVPAPPDPPLPALEDALPLPVEDGSADDTEVVHADSEDVPMAEVVEEPVGV